MSCLSLLVLGLQYKRNMWEGRYRHCLQAFQSFLSKLFQHRQDADCGWLSCVAEYVYGTLVVFDEEVVIVESELDIGFAIGLD